MSARHRSVRWIVGLAVAGALLAGGATGGRSLLDRLRDEKAIEAAPDEPTIVQASVRDLTETFSASGTLQFDEPIEVASPMSGTALAVASVGDSLTSGHVLAVVDDRAVVWLDGAVPAWRALENGDEGVDVLQLETALTALGFNDDESVTVDEEFTSATQDMVEAWQASLGVAETGRVELGAVVFGGDRTRVASVGFAVGDLVALGDPLAAIGTATRFATLDAAPEHAATLAIGDAVTLELPDRSTLDGSIAALTPGAESWTVTVAFGPDVSFPRADVTEVEMEWTHTVASGVVTIPSAALLRLDDGSYTVEVVNEDGSTTRVPVEIGSAVGTRVEVVSGLADGVSVVTI